MRFDGRLLARLVRSRNGSVMEKKQGSGAQAWHPPPSPRYRVRADGRDQSILPVLAEIEALDNQGLVDQQMLRLTRLATELNRPHCMRLAPSLTLALVASARRDVDDGTRSFLEACRCVMEEGLDG